MLHREDHGDVAAVRKTQDISLAYPPCVHEAQQVICKLPDRERSVTTRGLPVSPGIRGDDPEMPCERSHLMDEITGIFPIAMEKDQRIAGTGFDVVVYDVHILQQMYGIIFFYPFQFVPLSK